MNKIEKSWALEWLATETQLRCHREVAKVFAVCVIDCTPEAISERKLPSNFTNIHILITSFIIVIIIIISSSIFNFYFIFVKFYFFLTLSIAANFTITFHKN